MDRFIDAKGEFINYFHKYLKSNMDRFIVEFLKNSNCSSGYLKSNMDRFIAQGGYTHANCNYVFKIQYG